MPWCWGVVALCNGSLQPRVVRQESFQGWDFEVASSLACWWSPFTSEPHGRNDEPTAQESARIAAQNRLAPGIFQLPEVQYLGLWSNWKGNQPASQQANGMNYIELLYLYLSMIIISSRKETKDNDSMTGRIVSFTTYVYIGFCEPKWVHCEPKRMEDRGGKLFGGKLFSVRDWLESDIMFHSTLQEGTIMLDNLVFAGDNYRKTE